MEVKESGGVFAANPAKRWGEQVFLANAVLFICWFGFIVASGAYEGFNEWSYIGVGVGAILPCLTLPLLLRGTEYTNPDADLPWWEQYWVKSNVWIFIFSFIGNVHWTHYFYNLLGAQYIFDAFCINQVPIALILVTHAYFSFYFHGANVAIRWFSNLLPFSPSSTSFRFFNGFFIVLLSAFTALMEALTIASFPGYQISDRGYFYTVGSFCYGLYFVVGFPRFLQLDEGGHAPGMPRSRWSMSETVWDALASCMLVTVLLEAWKYIIGGLVSPLVASSTPTVVPYSPIPPSWELLPGVNATPPLSPTPLDPFGTDPSRIWVPFGMQGVRLEELEDSEDLTVEIGDRECRNAFVAANLSAAMPIVVCEGPPHGSSGSEAVVYVSSDSLEVTGNVFYEDIVAFPVESVFLEEWNGRSLTWLGRGGRRGCGEESRYVMWGEEKGFEHVWIHANGSMWNEKIAVDFGSRVVNDMTSIGDWDGDGRREEVLLVARTSIINVELMMLHIGRQTLEVVPVDPLLQSPSFGRCIVALGDLDMDGWAVDVAIGGVDQIVVAFLSPFGLPQGATSTILTSTLTSPLPPGSSFGVSVAYAGNWGMSHIEYGDPGIVGLAVGAPNYGGNKGAVVVGGLTVSDMNTRELSFVDVEVIEAKDVLPGEPQASNMGASVAVIGDVDGDGSLLEFVTTISSSSAPLLLIFFANDGAIRRVVKLGAGEGGWMGGGGVGVVGLTFVGDVDGDGVGDLAVSSSNPTENTVVLKMRDVATFISDDTGQVMSISCSTNHDFAIPVIPSIPHTQPILSGIGFGDEMESVLDFQLLLYSPPVSDSVGDVMIDGRSCWVTRYGKRASPWRTSVSCIGIPVNTRIYAHSQDGRTSAIVSMDVETDFDILPLEFHALMYLDRRAYPAPIKGEDGGEMVGVEGVGGAAWVGFVGSDGVNPAAILLGFPLENSLRLYSTPDAPTSTHLPIPSNSSLNASTNADFGACVCYLGRPQLSQFHKVLVGAPGHKSLDGAVLLLSMDVDGSIVESTDVNVGDIDAGGDGIGKGWEFGFSCASLSLSDTLAVIGEGRGGGVSVVAFGEDGEVNNVLRISWGDVGLSMMEQGFGRAVAGLPKDDLQEVVVISSFADPAALDVPTTLVLMKVHRPVSLEAISLISYEYLEPGHGNIPILQSDLFGASLARVDGNHGRDAIAVSTANGILVIDGRRIPSGILNPTAVIPAVQFSTNTEAAGVVFGGDFDRNGISDILVMERSNDGASTLANPHSSAQLYERIRLVPRKHMNDLYSAYTLHRQITPFFLQPSQLPVPYSPMMAEVLNIVRGDDGVHRGKQYVALLLPALMAYSNDSFMLSTVVGSLGSSQIVERSLWDPECEFSVTHNVIPVLVQYDFSKLPNFRSTLVHPSQRLQQSSRVNFAVLRTAGNLRIDPPAVRMVLDAANTNLAGEVPLALRALGSRQILFGMNSNERVSVRTMTVNGTIGPKEETWEGSGSGRVGSVLCVDAVRCIVGAPDRGKLWTIPSGEDVQDMPEELEDEANTSEFGASMVATSRFLNRDSSVPTPYFFIGAPGLGNCGAVVRTAFRRNESTLLPFADITIPPTPSTYSARFHETNFVIPCNSSSWVGLEEVNAGARFGASLAFLDRSVAGLFDLAVGMPGYGTLGGIAVLVDVGIRQVAHTIQSVSFLAPGVSPRFPSGVVKRKGFGSIVFQPGDVDGYGVLNSLIVGACDGDECDLHFIRFKMQSTSFVPHSISLLQQESLSSPSLLHVGGWDLSQKQLSLLTTPTATNLYHFHYSHIRIKRFRSTATIVPLVPTRFASSENITSVALSSPIPPLDFHQLFGIPEGGDGSQGFLLRVQSTSSNITQESIGVNIYSISLYRSPCVESEFASWPGVEEEDDGRNFAAVCKGLPTVNDGSASTLGVKVTYSEGANEVTSSFPLLRGSYSVEKTQRPLFARAVELDGFSGVEGVRSMAWIGDVNMDGDFHDLLLGNPTKGEVYVVLGGEGIGEKGEVLSGGVEGGSNQFGASVAWISPNPPHDFSWDGGGRVVIGAPGAIGNSGAVHIIPIQHNTSSISSSKLDILYDMEIIVTGNALSIGGGGEFGYAVAATPHDADAGVDLVVVGAPGEDKIVFLWVSVSHVVKTDIKVAGTSMTVTGTGPYRAGESITMVYKKDSMRVVTLIPSINTTVSWFPQSKNGAFQQATLKIDSVGAIEQIVGVHVEHLGVLWYEDQTLISVQVETGRLVYFTTQELRDPIITTTLPHPLSTPLIPGFVKAMGFVPDWDGKGHGALLLISSTGKAIACVVDDFFTTSTISDLRIGVPSSTSSPSSQTPFYISSSPQEVVTAFLDPQARDTSRSVLPILARFSIGNILLQSGTQVEVFVGDRKCREAEIDQESCDWENGGNGDGGCDAHVARVLCNGLPEGIPGSRPSLRIQLTAADANVYNVESSNNIPIEYEWIDDRFIAPEPTVLASISAPGGAVWATELGEGMMIVGDPTALSTRGTLRLVEQRRQGGGGVDFALHHVILGGSKSGTFLGRSVVWMERGYLGGGWEKGVVLLRVDLENDGVRDEEFDPVFVEAVSGNDAANASCGSSLAYIPGGMNWVGAIPAMGIMGVIAVGCPGKDDGVIVLVTVDHAGAIVQQSVQSLGSLGTHAMLGAAITSSHFYVTDARYVLIGAPRSSYGAGGVLTKPGLVIIASVSPSSSINTLSAVGYFGQAGSGNIPYGLLSSDARFGASVQTLGDLDGNGQDNEFAASAPTHALGPRVYLIFPILNSQRAGRIVTLTPTSTGLASTIFASSAPPKLLNPKVLDMESFDGTWTWLQSDGNGAVVFATRSIRAESSSKAFLHIQSSSNPHHAVTSKFYSPPTRHIHINPWGVDFLDLFVSVVGTVVPALETIVVKEANIDGFLFPFTWVGNYTARVYGPSAGFPSDRLYATLFLAYTNGKSGNANTGVSAGQYTPSELFLNSDLVLTTLIPGEGVLRGVLGLDSGGSSEFGYAVAWVGAYLEASAQRTLAVSAPGVPKIILIAFGIDGEAIAAAEMELDLISDKPSRYGTSLCELGDMDRDGIAQEMAIGWDEELGEEFGGEGIWIVWVEEGGEVGRYVEYGSAKGGFGTAIAFVQLLHPTLFVSAPRDFENDVYILQWEEESGKLVGKGGIGAREFITCPGGGDEIGKSLAVLPRQRNEHPDVSVVVVVGNSGGGFVSVGVNASASVLETKEFCPGTSSFLHSQILPSKLGLSMAWAGDWAGLNTDGVVFGSEKEVLFVDFENKASTASTHSIRRIDRMRSSIPVHAMSWTPLPFYGSAGYLAVGDGNGTVMLRAPGNRVALPANRDQVTVFANHSSSFSWSCVSHAPLQAPRCGKLTNNSLATTVSSESGFVSGGATKEAFRVLYESTQIGLEERIRNAGGGVVRVKIGSIADCGRVRIVEHWVKDASENITNLEQHQPLPNSQVQLACYYPFATTATLRSSSGVRVLHEIVSVSVSVVGEYGVSPFGSYQSADGGTKTGVGRGNGVVSLQLPPSLPTPNITLQSPITPLSPCARFSVRFFFTDFLVQEEESQLIVTDEDAQVALLQRRGNVELGEVGLDWAQEGLMQGLFCDPPGSRVSFSVQGGIEGSVARNELEVGWHVVDEVDVLSATGLLRVLGGTKIRIVGTGFGALNMSQAFQYYASCRTRWNDDGFVFPTNDAPPSPLVNEEPTIGFWVYVGVRPCEQVIWESSTEVLCIAPHGHGEDMPVGVMMLGKMAVGYGKVSYERHADPITSVTSTLQPSQEGFALDLPQEGGSLITLRGEMLRWLIDFPSDPSVVRSARFHPHWELDVNSTVWVGEDGLGNVSVPAGVGGLWSVVTCTRDPTLTTEEAITFMNTYTPLWSPEIAAQEICTSPTSPEVAKVAYRKPTIVSVRPSADLSPGESLTVVANNLGARELLSILGPSPLTISLRSGIVCGRLARLTDDTLSCTSPTSLPGTSVQVVVNVQYRRASDNAIVSSIASDPVSVSVLRTSVIWVEPYRLLPGLEGKHVVDISIDTLGLETVANVWVGGLECPTFEVEVDGRILCRNFPRPPQWPSDLVWFEDGSGRTTLQRSLLRTQKPPAIIGLATPNGVGTLGGSIVRVLGQGFGVLSGDCVVVVGSGESVVVNVATESLSFSSTQIELPIPPGVGAQVALRVRTRYDLESEPFFFSYDPPSITSVTPSSIIAGTLNASIILCGENFPPLSNTSFSATIGGIPCPSISIHTNTCILCSNLSTPQSSPIAPLQWIVDGVEVFVGGQRSGLVSGLVELVPPPSVTSVTPKIAGPSDVLELGGVGLSVVVKVLVGEEACWNLTHTTPPSPTPTSTSILTCIIPSTHKLWNRPGATTDFVVPNVAITTYTATGLESSPTLFQPRGLRLRPPPSTIPRGLSAWRELGLSGTLVVRWRFPSRSEELLLISENGEGRVTKFSIQVFGFGKEEEVGGLDVARSDSIQPFSTATWEVHEVVVPIVWRDPVQVRVRAANDDGEGEWGVVEGWISETCLADEYLSTHEEEKVRCHPCPEGAVCAGLGSENVTAQSEYWRVPWAGNPALGFASCPIQGACLGHIGKTVRGGNRTNHNLPSHGIERQWAEEDVADRPFAVVGARLVPSNYENCRLGHRGVLCAACEPGYFPGVANVCTTCGDRGWIAGRFLLLLLVMMAALSAILMRAWKVRGSSSSREIQVMRLLLNHIQSISIIGSVNLVWPQSAKEFFSIVDIGSSFSTSGLALECLLGESSRSPFARTLVIISMPLWLIVFASLLWLVIGFIQGKQRLRRSLTSPRLATTPLPTTPQPFLERARCCCTCHFDFQTYQKQMLVSMIVIAFLIHTPVSSAAFRLLTCRQVAPDDDPSSTQLRLAMDMDVSCEDEESLAAMLGIGIPTLVLVSLGIPIASAVGLWWVGGEKLELPEWKASFGVLYSGLRKGLYGFESVVLLRKVLLSFVTTVLAPSGGAMQLLAAFLVILAAQLIHSRVRPYTSTIVNSLESFALVTASLTLVGGMFVVMDEYGVVGTSGEGVVGESASIMIAVVNTLFFLAAIILLSHRARHTLTNTLQEVRSWGEDWFGVGKVEKLQTTGPQEIVGEKKSVEGC